MNATIQKFEGDWNGGRSGTIRLPYPQLVEILGEKHGGPSADDKADVEWHFVSKTNPAARFAVWNFKNGPAFTRGRVRMEDVKEFSLSFSFGDGVDQAASLQLVQDVFGKAFSPDF